MKSPLLTALSLTLAAVLALPFAQAQADFPVDGRALERCLVNGGSSHVLSDGRVACCLERSCIICDQQSCVGRWTSTPPTCVDPGNGGGLNGGTYSSQAPGAVFQYGN